MQVRLLNLVMEAVQETIFADASGHAILTFGKPYWKDEGRVHLQNEMVDGERIHGNKSLLRLRRISA